jgi:hypothetical protein
MNLRVVFLCALLSVFHGQNLAAQETKSAAPRHITLE